MRRSERNEAKTKKYYYCGYCGHYFQQGVRRTGGGKDTKGNNIDAVSSQVECIKCGNFLKTW